MSPDARSTRPLLLLSGIIITFALKPLNTMIMNEQSLLKAFLNNAPESSNPFDMERFVAYVHECWQNNSAVDWNALEILSSEKQRELEVVEPWLVIAFEYLKGKH